MSSSAPFIVGRGTTAEPRALIVEDDAAVRRGLARILKRMGFVVATSESGEQALDRVRRGERFELVVSDVEMSGMDGPAFCEAARSVWAEIDAVIVFATGGPRVLEARNLRSVRWFSKPLDATFYAHVRDVLERARRTVSVDEKP